MKVTGFEEASRTESEFLVELPYITISKIPGSEEDRGGQVNWAVVAGTLLLLPSATTSTATSSVLLFGFPYKFLSVICCNSKKIADDLMRHCRVNSEPPLTLTLSI